MKALLLASIASLALMGQAVAFEPPDWNGKRCSDAVAFAASPNNKFVLNDITSTLLSDIIDAQTDKQNADWALLPLPDQEAIQGAFAGCVGHPALLFKVSLRQSYLRVMTQAAKDAKQK